MWAHNETPLIKEVYMGICLTSRKSSYSFEMGYCGFNNLRTNICKVFDKELGEVYADTLFALNDPQLISQGANNFSHLGEWHFLFACF